MREKKFNKMLEDTFGMNAKLDEIKSKMSFNKPEKSKKVSFSRKGILVSCLIASIFCSGVGVGCYYIGNYIGSNHNKYYYENQNIKNGMERIELIYSAKYITALSMFNLTEDNYMYLYSGLLSEKENTKSLFYQFVFGVKSINSFKVIFANEYNQKYNVNISDDNNIGKIGDENFILDSILYITVTISDQILLDASINL